MKKYRVVYRPLEMPNTGVRTEEVLADSWRVDVDRLCMYRKLDGEEIRVFEIPKAAVTRIIEVV
jgi:hypothetical protein